jgi:hypothetical protein
MRGLRLKMENLNININKTKCLLFWNNIQATQLTVNIDDKLTREFENNFFRTINSPAEWAHHHGVVHPWVADGDGLQMY